MVNTAYIRHGLGVVLAHLFGLLVRARGPYQIISLSQPQKERMHGRLAP